MRGNFIERHEKILSSGVDWLTVSHADAKPGEPFDEIATALLRGSCLEGEQIRLGTWLGYAGLRTSSAFYGWQSSKAVCWLSGPHNAALTADLIKASSNVSRIDLQLTVEHTPADPRLGAINFRRASAYTGRPGMKPVISEIHDTRHAYTMAVGRRISNQYGRHYDKGVESKSAEPGRRWRFEVEYKRDMAEKIAAQIALSDKVEADCARSVYRWWASRGVSPLQREPRGCLIDTTQRAPLKPAYLEWFSTKVARSVHKAVEQHGLAQVIESLGLSAYLGFDPTEGAAQHESYQHPLQVDSGRVTPRQQDAESVLVHGQDIFADGRGE